MNRILTPALVVIGLMFSLQGAGQQGLKNGLSNQGKMFFYWGYNWSGYTDSDIRFTGDHYNFTLTDVVAVDRQSSFEVNTYLNPTKFTYPQYNFRIGYFIRDDLSISIAIEHMKYVVTQLQEVQIDGYIEQSTDDHTGIFENANKTITPDFLKYEHSDGLNYENIEVTKYHTLATNGILATTLLVGANVGVFTPKTNVTLLNKTRHDALNIAGYGLGLNGGIKLNLNKSLFVQSESKVGFAHLPNVRTTESKSDKASQHFFYYQFNVTLGAHFRVNSKKSLKHSTLEL